MESYGAVQSAGTGVTVPDATLLFTGDFSRSGTDLILTGADGAKFVVTGYFDTDTPPSLLSPQGAMLTGDVVSSLAGPQFPGMYAQAGDGAAQGAKEIGKVQTLDGSATVVRASGVTETLNVGDPVFEGDVVQTGPGSKLGIGFLDGTVFSMSSNARMVLNKLVYNPDGSDNSMLFSLVEGSFVFAAGKIAPTGDMKIQTPVATMGIRGTAPTVDINSESGTVNFSIVPNPDDGHIGTYTLYSLDTGQPIGTISSVGTMWVLTSADGSITEIEKSQEDLLRDADAVNQINQVYNTYTANTQNQQNPQAGPENNPPQSSGGFNTNPNEGENIDGGGNTDGGGGNEPQNNNNQNNSQPNNNPPPINETNDDPPPPIEDPTEGAGVNVINGTPFNDNSGDGVDDKPEIVGTNGDDFIFGFAGNDIIYDHGGNDVVDAGDDHDIIVAGAGNDDYDGGEGIDTVDYSAATQSVDINLVDSTVNSAEFGFDTIASLERFVTGGGDDTLVIGEGSLPDNFFWEAGGGTDTVLFEGALNIDTRTFEGEIENLEVIDLNETDNNVLIIQADDFQDGENESTDNTLTFLGGVGDTLALGSELEIDGQTVNGEWQSAGMQDGLEVYEFTDGQTVYATALVDPDVNVISETQLGDQSAQTRAPFSLSLAAFFVDLDGGQPLDFELEPVNPEASLPSWLNFNSETGELSGRPGRNDDEVIDLKVTVTDENGATLVQQFTLRTGEIGDDGFNFMTGSNGDDVIAGLDGIDVISGRRGDDQIFGDDGSDNLVGDTIIKLFGQNGDNDTIDGGAGNDFIVGDNEGGLSVGDGGDDTIFGGAGDDYIIGDNYLALHSGDGGNDTIFGGDGNDTIFGDDVDVLFSGDGGNDTIIGGLGVDTITGGGGSDIFVYNSIEEGGDIITDFTGLDAFDLTDILADAISNVLPDGEQLSSVIDQFIQAITDNDGNTTVGVDVNGEEGGQDFTTLATLQANQGFNPANGITVIIGEDDVNVTPVA